MLKVDEISKAELHKADLGEAKLEGAAVMNEQLAQAKSLKGATLPDGTKLSVENWQFEFEEWREGQGTRGDDNEHDDDNDDD